MLRVRGGVSISLKSACIRTQCRGSNPQRCSRYCTKTEPPAKAPAAEPPQPAAEVPPPKSSGGFLKVLGAGVLLAGGAAAGTIGYAKTNPEFRQQVESNLPILVPVIPYLFNETEDSVATLAQPQLGAKKSVEPLAKLKSRLEENRAQVPPTTLEPVPTQAPVTVEKSKTPATSVTKEKKDDASKNELLWKKEKEEKRAQEMQQKLADQEKDAAADVAAFDAILSNVVQSSVGLIGTAIDSQKAAVEATNIHTQKLKIALDDPTSDSAEKENQWKDVVRAAESKLATLQVAEMNSVAAQEELEKLKSVIGESKKSQRKGQQSSPAIIGAEEGLKMLTYDLKQQTAEVVRAQTEAKMLQEYQALIDEGREKFKKELESIVPDVKLGRKGKKLTEDELNSLIAHAHRRIEQLQRQLAEQQAMEQERIAVVLNKQRTEDRAISESEINRELDRQAGDLAYEQQIKLKEHRRQNEEEMRIQLRRQAAAHSDHLQEVLRIQAKEFEEEIGRHEAVVREEEVVRYQEKMVECLAKLKGIENAIEGHAANENRAKRSHELWLACETFKRTIATGNPEGKTMEERLKPLANEVVAIKQATSDNAFVDAVTGAIPETALLRGVYNEVLLKGRWQNVRSTCQRVSMVSEDGGSLFQYFLSFFQSLLLFTDPMRPKLDEDIDVSTLDTCKILSYANYYVEKGDLEQAVRYVNQLTGLPKQVASDWLTEAKLLLETNQAASALSAHASASGLGGISL